MDLKQLPKTNGAGYKFRKWKWITWRWIWLVGHVCVCVELWIKKGRILGWHRGCYESSAHNAVPHESCKQMAKWVHRCSNVCVLVEEVLGKNEKPSLKYIDYRHSYVSTLLSYGFAFSVFLLIWLSNLKSVVTTQNDLIPTAFDWSGTIGAHKVLACQPDGCASEGCSSSYLRSSASLGLCI